MGNGMPNGWVNCMTAKNSEVLLIGTQGGLVSYNWHTQVLDEFRVQEFLGKNINSVVKTQDGDCLIGVENTIFVLNSQGEVNKSFSLTEIDRVDPNLWLSGLVQDKDGVIWVTTQRKEKNRSTTDSERDPVGEAFRLENNILSIWKFPLPKKSGLSNS